MKASNIQNMTQVGAEGLPQQHKAGTPLPHYLDIGHVLRVRGGDVLILLKAPCGRDFTLHSILSHPHNEQIFGKGMMKHSSKKEKVFFSGKGGGIQ